MAYIECGCGKQDVRGLGYVSGVQAVVIGYIGVIVVLQGQHERHKGVSWNLERPHQVSLLYITKDKQDVNSGMGVLQKILQPVLGLSICAEMALGAISDLTSWKDEKNKEAGD